MQGNLAVGIQVDTTLSNLYIEYRLAEAARENAYDEMLTRRGDYIELYGLDMDADTRNGNDEMYELLNAIDNHDWEFWQFHNNVNQRYSNAAEAFGRVVGVPEQDLLRTFGGHNTDIVLIDWERHQNDGMHQPERYVFKGE